MVRCDTILMWRAKVFWTTQLHPTFSRHGEMTKWFNWCIWKENVVLFRKPIRFMTNYEDEGLKCPLRDEAVWILIELINPSTCWTITNMRLRNAICLCGSDPSWMIQEQNTVAIYFTPCSINLIQSAGFLTELDNNISVFVTSQCWRGISDSFYKGNRCGYLS